MLAEMHSLTVAGHETTSNTLTWMLYELARHPEYQARVRAEIRAARAAVVDRGESAFTMDDLDGMKVTLAVIKVCLAGLGSLRMSATYQNCGGPAAYRKPYASTQSSSTSGAWQARTTSSRSPNL